MIGIPGMFIYRLFPVSGKNLYNNEHVAIKLVSIACLLFHLSLSLVCTTLVITLAFTCFHDGQSKLYAFYFMSCYVSCK